MIFYFDSMLLHMDHLILTSITP